MGRKMVRTAALVACMMVLVAGVALAADIKVGHLAALTGPTSSVGNPYAKGVQDYKNSVNAHGGINGKQIDMKMFDYAYDKNKAVNQYKKYLEEKVIAIQGWGTGDTEALTGFLAADKIPYLSASYSPNLTDPKEAPYNFFIAADYTTQLRAGLKKIKENWKEERVPHPVGCCHHQGRQEAGPQDEVPRERLGQRRRSDQDRGGCSRWRSRPPGRGGIRRQRPRNEAHQGSHQERAPEYALHPGRGGDDGAVRGAEQRRQERAVERSGGEGCPGDVEGFRYGRADFQDHVHPERPPSEPVGPALRVPEGEGRLQDDDRASAQGRVAPAVNETGGGGRGGGGEFPSPRKKKKN